MISRTRGTWAAASIVLGLAAIASLSIVAFSAGYLRSPINAYLQARFDRPIRLAGPMHVELWSRHPRIVAQRVFIGNPPWVAAGDTARIERLTLIFDAPGFGHGAVLQSIAIDGATLHLVRDAAGHANWQRYDPDSGRVGKGLPLIRELIATDIRLSLDDQRRHLQFEGTVTARGQGFGSESTPLHMQGKGTLNGRSVMLELNGDPLSGAQRETPYGFELTEQSSGSRAALHGTLPQPFNVTVLDGTFETAGPDLKDLYFLTGMNLVNTGDYRLSGSIARRGTSTSFDRLKLTTGQSDLAANLSTQPEGGTAGHAAAATGRSRLQGTITAGVLHLADFGARAAGRPSAPPRLFSEAALNPEALRRSDTQLRFEARRVDVGRTTLQSLAGQLSIDHGIVRIAAVRGGLLHGTFEAGFSLDVNQSMPTAAISMRFTDLQLGDVGPPQKERPIEGLMQARIDITGRGASLHDVAASASGSFSATLPRGTIREAVAELSGVDLRGLGLALTRSKRETAVRCAAAAFDALNGTLTARTLVIDTEPVLIKGEGTIDLDTESVDLQLRGEPKDLRLLRLDAPLSIRGPLMRPTVALQTHEASVKLIDPGHARSVDCAALLSP